jgi:hypothetical protein
MQKRLDTNPKKDTITPTKQMSSMDGNVAILKSFRILIQVGRSMKERTLSWRKSPFIGSTWAGTTPSRGLNKPETMKSEIR